MRVVDIDSCVDSRRASAIENCHNIRLSALRIFAANGVESTSLRAIAEDAGVSVGLVQHHFGNKAKLIAAVDRYVVDQLRDVAASPTVNPDGVDPTVDEVGQRTAALITFVPEVSDYIARALVDDMAVGREIFDSLHADAVVRWRHRCEKGLVRSDVDPVWLVLHPLLLALAPIVLRHHLTRHLDEPFQSAVQIRRCFATGSAMIQTGFMQQPD
jgi:AcrR family transcriptional regulator